MSIPAKKNKCKGTGKAINYGCGKLVYRFKYGMCAACYRIWLYSSDEGKRLIAAIIPKAKKKVIKESKPKRKHIKWTDKDFQEMVKYVQIEICNPYIRLRDNESYGVCISSRMRIMDAGHFYPRSTDPKLRFCVQNIHGQNGSDNRFMGGNLIKYQDGLISRHGRNYVVDLKKLKDSSHKWPKLDKNELIKIGKTFEYLTKRNIWCFTHIEFENYKNILHK